MWAYRITSYSSNRFRVFSSRHLTGQEMPTYSFGRFYRFGLLARRCLMMNNGTTKNALHLATHSGWYRFEQREESWIQVDRALTYWLMTCIQSIRIIQSEFT